MYLKLSKKFLLRAWKRITLILWLKTFISSEGFIEMAWKQAEGKINILHLKNVLV